MAWTLRFFDDFTGPDELTLNDHSPIWISSSDFQGDVTLISNGARGRFGNNGYGINLTALANDQAVEAKVWNCSEWGCWIGLRHTNHGGGNKNFSGYWARYWWGQVELNRQDEGVTTALGSWSRTPTDGDTLRIEAVGNQLSVYVNGVLIGSAEDSTYTSGGCAFGTDDQASRIDDFAAYDDDGGGEPGPPAVLLFLHHYRQQGIL